MKTPGGWAIVGYIPHEQSAKVFVATPVLSFAQGKEYYYQIDYRSSLNRFSIVRLEASLISSIVRCVERACSPLSQLIVFLSFNSDLVYGDLSENRHRLEVLIDACPLAVRLQVEDMLKSTTGSDPSWSHLVSVVGQSSARYLSAALSTDAVFQIALSRAPASIPKEDVLKICLGAIELIHNWQLDNSNISKLTPYLDVTGLAIDQLTAILRSKKTALEGSVVHADIKPENLWHGISLLRRQERRLARMLKIYIETPDRIPEILAVYRTSNFLEGLILKDIADIYSHKHADQHQRELQVAHYIPRFIRAEFGAQRGKLLYDLATELSSYTPVCDVLRNEFNRRSHTWTVGAWAENIAQALGKANNGLL